MGSGMSTPRTANYDHSLTIAAIVTTIGRDSFTNALASIKHQSRPPDQLIVVYDTPKPPRNLGAPNIIWTGYLRNASLARNLGAAEANCKFLAFLDDDDVWLSEHLREVDAALNDQSIDVVCTSCYRLDDAGLLLGSVAPAALRPSDFFTSNPGFRGSNLIIRKSLLLGLGGFNANLLSHNDLDLAIRLADCGAKYRGLIARTVVFCDHAGIRLSSAGSFAKCTGLRQFWALYKDRMTENQRKIFQRKARRLWRCMEWYYEFWPGNAS